MTLRYLIVLCLCLAATDLAGCTKAKLKAGKKSTAVTTVTPTQAAPAASPSPVAPNAGFAITAGGGISTHPNIQMQSTIGTIGRPIIQTGASAQSANGLQGVLYQP